MARTVIAIQKMQSHAVLSPPLETDSDSVNNHSFKNTGKEILAGKNTGAGAVQLTIKSTPDNLRRSVDVVKSIAAGDSFTCTPFPTAGFNQVGGVVNVDVDVDTDLKLWVTKQEG